MIERERERRSYICSQTARGCLRAGFNTPGVTLRITLNTMYIGAEFLTYIVVNYSWPIPYGVYLIIQSVLSAFATCGLSKLTLTREKAGQYFLGKGCNPCNIDGFEIETMSGVLRVNS